MKTYFMKNRACFAGALVSVLISTVFAVTLQFFKGDVLDCAVVGDAENTVKYALFLIVFILCETGFYNCYRRFGAVFETRCTGGLKEDIFQSILRRSYVAYREQPQGAYIAKYTSAADAVKSRYFHLLPIFFEILFKIILVGAALFLLDCRIAVVTILLLTTPLYVPKLIEKKLQDAQSDYIEAAERALSKVNDWLAGFEMIKNYSVEAKIMDRFRQVNDDEREKLLRDMRLGAASQLLTTLISYLSYFIVLVCAAWLVVRKEFTAGDFFIAIGMIDQLSYPLISLAGVARELIAVRPVCEELEQFLAVPGEERTRTKLRSVARDIRFCNVTFAYEDQMSVLRDFNLNIRKGKRYLFKGQSGSGKTTAVNLLLRYYDVKNGSIRVDDVPIEAYGSTYESMTVVRQEAVLFHDTLRNNLTMYEDIPDEKLIGALESLGLTKYANTGALDRIIAENGGNLSGGEKKRICLARALLRDTDVLIFDEPLANLDSGNAKRIEDLLLRIEEKTILIVSHQFSEEKLERFEQVVDFAFKEVKRF